MAKKQRISRSFLIGIFVLTGLTLLVGFLLWMGATQFLQDYDYYVTYFEESVGGLENGSSVKYLGVSCGLVESISIAPDGRLVEVVLKVRKGLKISDSLMVKLEMAGLAGGKYIQLTSAKDATPNQFKLAFEPPYPVLPSAPSQLDELALSAEKIISDIKNIQWKQISNGLVGTLDGASNIVNNKDLAGILADLHQTTQAITALVDKISGSSSDNLEATTASIAQTAKQAEKFAATMNTKIDSVDIPLYLDKMYTDFNGTINTVNNAIEAVTTKFQSSMLGINIIMEELNQTNKAVQKTLRNINESPYMFLTEPPPADEVKQKK
ncbi:MAG: MlaD family protein [Ignavibacteria bacterium]|jgi:phospholipid/cholesterol/gamma-HCH transport system substrate-binding protein|nr:MlaD family protein [Ignavibacteria bacterium]